MSNIDELLTKVKSRKDQEVEEVQKCEDKVKRCFLTHEYGSMKKSAGDLARAEHVLKTFEETETDLKNLKVLGKFSGGVPVDDAVLPRLQESDLIGSEIHDFDSSADEDVVKLERDFLEKSSQH
ncbi:hypothetical protein GEMRC1_010738 [Eukaryota sp. GEM-RC1]